MVGGVLAAFTVNTKFVEAVSVPSLTVTVIVEVPLSPAAGVMTTLRSCASPTTKNDISNRNQRCVGRGTLKGSIRWAEVSASPTVKAIGACGSIFIC